MYMSSYPLCVYVVYVYVAHNERRKAMIKLSCPQCNRGLSAPDDYEGKRVACKHCNHEFRVLRNRSFAEVRSEFNNRTLDLRAAEPTNKHDPIHELQPARRKRTLGALCWKFLRDTKGAWFVLAGFAGALVILLRGVGFFQTSLTLSWAVVFACLLAPLVLVGLGVRKAWRWFRRA